jgi:hypothetical protein
MTLCIYKNHIVIEAQYARLHPYNPVAPTLRHSIRLEHISNIGKIDNPFPESPESTPEQPEPYVDNIGIYNIGIYWIEVCNVPANQRHYIKTSHTFTLNISKDDYHTLHNHLHTLNPLPFTPSPNINPMPHQMPLTCPISNYYPSFIYNCPF